MRIGIDGNEANIQKRVGSNTFAYEVLKRLPLKHQYKVFLKNPPLPDFPKNLSYEVVKPSPYWTQIALPIRLFLKRDIDIFYSSSHYAPRFCPVPEIITIYDLSFEKFPQYFKKSDLIKLKSWTSYSVKKANHIITISEYSKKDIIDFYKIPENKITVAYPGYNPDVYKVIGSSKEIEITKNKYGIKGKYIIFVGTLQPRKNLPVLLEAVQKLKDINLAIVGKKGWLYEDIFKKVKSLGIENRVVFTDFIPDTDIALLLNGAEYFVLPSFYEGFGIPVIESFACGCPVIAADTSSLPEIVGNAGELFYPDSAPNLLSILEKLLNDVKYREDLIKKGLKRAKLFNWEDCTSQITKVLESQKL